MRKGLSVLVITFVFLNACANQGGTRSMNGGTPTLLTTKQPPATETPTPIPTLDPSVAPVPQLVDDLANRLEVPRDQVALQGLRPVLWQKDGIQCPPPPDTSIPLEHVMIVTEEGARYEPPAEDLKLGKDTALLVLLLVEETTYPYYVLEDRFLFCPNGE